MRVKELMDILSSLNPDKEIVVDAEIESDGFELTLDINENAIMEDEKFYYLQTFYVDRDKDEEEQVNVTHKIPCQVMWEKVDCILVRQDKREKVVPKAEIIGWDFRKSLHDIHEITLTNKGYNSFMKIERRKTSGLI